LDIKSILGILIGNDQFNRQTGRTTVLKEASEKIGADFISQTELSIKKLLGSRKPFILDHYAQQLIFSECLSKINKMENKLEKIKQILMN